MTFREKIDTIIKQNTLGINSVFMLEKFIGTSPSSINKYYKKDKEPGRATVKKIITGLNLRPDWWETCEGEMFESSESPLVLSLREQISLLKELCETYKAEIERLKKEQ